MRWVCEILIVVLLQGCISLVSSPDQVLCYNLGGLYGGYLFILRREESIVVLELSIPKDDSRWTEAFLILEYGECIIRAIPDILGVSLGYITKNQNCYTITEEKVSLHGYVWYPYLLDPKQDAVHSDTGEFSSMGWIREDTVRTTLTGQAEAMPTNLNE